MDRCCLHLRVAVKVFREDSDTVVTNPVKLRLCAELRLPRKGSGDLFQRLIELRTSAWEVGMRK